LRFDSVNFFGDVDRSRDLKTSLQQLLPNFSGIVQQKTALIKPEGKIFYDTMK